jgi:uncharacterized protein
VPIPLAFSAVPFSLLHLLEALAIGLAAGVIGGMAGIGGSLVMLPALGFFLGYDEPERTRQHLYMAAAMVVNAVVSIPATYTHAKAGSVRRNLVLWVVGPMIPAMIGGVALSDRLDGHRLIDFLALFILAYCVLNVVRVIGRTPDASVNPIDAPRTALVVLGIVTGLIGGLLGIGGGVVMVPALQLLFRVPLKNAIAASSAVMVVTAIVGSTAKLTGLGGHGQNAADALVLAAAMAPTAFIGGLIGAKLTQRLPVPIVRVIISVVLAAAAARLAFAHRPPTNPNTEPAGESTRIDLKTKAESPQAEPAKSK